MFFPEYRARRLRRSESLRSMVRETFLRPEDLIYPMFSAFGKNVRKEIISMPGIYQQSIEHIVAEAKEVYELGIPAVILFGIPAEKLTVSGNTKFDFAVEEWTPERLAEERARWGGWAQEPPRTTRRPCADGSSRPSAAL